MKIKKILLFCLLLIIGCLAFAQNVILDSGAVVTPAMQESQGIRDLIVDALALIILAMLGALCTFLTKLIHININKNMVLGKITEMCVDVKAQTIYNNEQKKQYVIEQIRQNKKVSKWATIIYGGLGSAVDLVFQSVMKKGSKK